MSVVVAVVVFVVSLAVTLASSEALVRGLDRLGARLGLTEGLLGLLTALGADSPEISSALVALHDGARDVGLGVVLGSNVFNLAGLLGLSAVLAGRVRVRREGLALDGGVALLVTVVVAALVFGVLAPVPACALLAVIVVPYIVALGVPPRRLRELVLPGHAAPGGLTRGVAIAVREVDEEAAEDPRVSHAAGSWRAAMLVLPALALIVASSIAMVTAALALATAWHLPQAFVGSIVLAVLTSLPNAYTAARLALQGRGAAVVSETLNSNTINVVAGVAIPSLILGAAMGGQAELELAWLAGMTVLALLLLARKGGLTRPGGLAIIGLYALYVVMRVTT